MFNLCKAKICDFQITIPINHNVLRLEITIE